MKNYYLLFPLLWIISFLSCAKEEEFGQAASKNPIHFRSGQGTKGIVLDNNNVTTIGVLAYQSIQSGFDESSTSGTPLGFFYNQQVSKDGSTGSWLYSPIRNWPADPANKLSFFAYAPHNPAGMTLCPNGTKGTPYFDYVVPDHPSAQTDLMVTQLLDKDYSTPTVGLEFEHVLTQVKFMAKVGADAIGTTRITSIKLYPIKNKGTLRYGNSTNGYSPTWTISSAASDTVSYLSTISNGALADVSLTSTLQEVQNLNNTLMLLPQLLYANVYLDVVFETVDNFGVTHVRSMHKNLNELGLNNLPKGKMILFQLEYGATLRLEYTIQPIDVTDWELGYLDQNATVIGTPFYDYSNKISNCYLLAPNNQHDKTYRIPVIRSDQFWGDAAYVGTVDQNNLLTSSTGVNNTWTVSLLWMDESGLVKTSGTKDITITKSSGVGRYDYFEIKVPSQAKTYGNFVVGIKKGSSGPSIAGGDCLWSWHFWVTTYDLYGIITGVTGNTYQWSVPGGKLHKYDGSLWTTEYLGKRIIDRYVGFKDAGNDQLYCTYYQYGRKDPFPLTGISLYNLSGLITPATYAPVTGPKTMQWTIQNPARFVKSSSGDWLTTPIDNVTSLKTWNDVKLSSTASGVATKSIFDPSPWNYKLPRVNATQSTWSEFTISTVVENGFPNSGLITYQISQARYDASGWIDPTSGLVANRGSYGYVRSSIPESPTSAYNFSFYKPTSTLYIYPIATASRAAGMSIRPILE